MGSKAERWLRDLEACESLAREVSGVLGERDSFPRTSVNFSRLTSSARQGLRQLDTSILQLQKDLSLPEMVALLTRAEAERRQRSLETLRSRERQLWDFFHNPAQRLADPTVGRSVASARQELFGVRDGGTIGWEGGSLETEETRNYTEDDIRTMRRDIIQRQDEGLDILAASIARQKNMAGAINEEVDAQNDLIDDIFDGMDHTRDRLLRETQNVKVVVKKTRTFGYWVVIILLLIAIIVVSVV